MPPILIYRSKEKNVESIILKGMPLGHIVNFPYSVSKIQLYPGDIILISSDGLTELFNDRNEMIESETISSLLNNASNKSPQEIILDLNTLIKKWSGKIEPQDDITIIVIKVI